MHGAAQLDCKRFLIGPQVLCLGPEGRTAVSEWFRVWWTPSVYSQRFLQLKVHLMVLRMRLRISSCLSSGLTRLAEKLVGMQNEFPVVYFKYCISLMFTCLFLEMRHHAFCNHPNNRNSTNSRDVFYDPLRPLTSTGR